MQLKVAMDYAVRTLMYLARHKGIVPIAEIEEAMKISEKYLNRLGFALRDEGLIVTQYDFFLHLKNTNKVWYRKTG